MKTKPPIVQLTERQHRIAALIARNVPRKTIAAELGISESGVKVHQRALEKKFKAKLRLGIATAFVEAFGPVQMDTCPNGHLAPPGGRGILKA